MKKKLLDKTLRVYISVALIVMMISAPLFYWVSDRLFIRSADETLFVHKKEFIENYLPSLRKEDIATWNKISHDVRIENYMAQLKRDSVFFHVYYNKFEDENEKHRVLLSPITIEGKPYTLFARVNLIESEDLISSIILLFCTLLFFLLAGLYFVTRRLSNRIWLPFYSTLNQIEQFKLDKNEKPEFGFTDTEEFSRLNQSIERLIERNLLNYKSQKEFIENAAHELQTPLAVFQAKLDVLTQQIPMTNELGNTFLELNKTISMMNRVNKNLLLLSRMENDQYDTTEKVLLSDVITRQVKFINEQAEAKKVTVHFESGEPLVVMANLTLTEIAISNLLLNALRYNKADGELWILLNQRSLVISNTSNHGELPSENLFLRFTSRGEEGGNGLGLSIVKKISDLHSWTVTYTYRDSKHFFQIAF